MLDLDDALAHAISLAHDGGKIARKQHHSSLGFDPKADNSPVTLADIAINRLVVERCREKYPEMGVLGEEECGGRVTDLDGNEQRYDGLLNGAIVAHPDYAEEIIRITREARQ